MKYNTLMKHHKWEVWRKSVFDIYFTELNKGNNKITELQTILQRESQNS
jgi:hypothetical protein